MGFETENKAAKPAPEPSPKLYDRAVLEHTKVVFNDDVVKDKYTEEKSVDAKTKKEKIDVKAEREEYRQLVCFCTFGLYKGASRVADVTRSFSRKYASKDDVLSKVDEVDIDAERQALIAAVNAEYVK